MEEADLLMRAPQSALRAQAATKESGATQGATNQFNL